MWYLQAGEREVEHHSRPEVLNFHTNSYLAIRSRAPIWRVQILTSTVSMGFDSSENICISNTFRVVGCHPKGCHPSPLQGVKHQGEDLVAGLVVVSVGHRVGGAWRPASERLRIRCSLEWSSQLRYKLSICGWIEGTNLAC